MRVERYDNRVRRQHAFFHRPFVSTGVSGMSDYEEGNVYQSGCIVGYARVGNVVTVYRGRRLMLRERRATAWHQAKQ